MPIPSNVELLGKMSEASVLAMYGLCPRKARNMLEGKYCKKGKSGLRVTLKSSQDRARDAIAVCRGIVAAGDEQMAEELIKTYLYSKRPMLKDTLDFLGIPNEDGITEQELDLLEKADVKLLKELIARLRDKGHSLEDIAVYFAFTKVERYADLTELEAVWS